MPNRIRYLYSNLYTAAATVLTASSAAATLPVGNSQSYDRSHVFRSGTVAVAVTIDVDLGSTKALTAAAFANLRLFSGGALEIYDRGTAGTPGAATLKATLPASDSYRRATVGFFTSFSARHVQIKFTNPGAVSSYVELGFAFLGEYFEPTVNVRVPMDTEIVDPSVVARSVDGQKSTTLRTTYEIGTQEHYFVPEADQATFQAIQTAIGVRVPIFLVLDTALSWTCWMAFFTSAIRRRFEEATGRYTVSYAWEEAR